MKGGGVGNDEKCKSKPATKKQNTHTLGPKEALQHPGEGIQLIPMLIKTKQNKNTPGTVLQSKPSFPYSES